MHPVFTLFTEILHKIYIIFCFLGPGISSCSYSCFRKSYCGFEEIAVSDIPVECTSLNYVGAFVDEYYGVGPGNSGTDYSK